MKLFKVTFLYENQSKSITLEVNSTAEALGFVKRVFKGYKRLTLVIL